jgi:hypothetical protein
VVAFGGYRCERSLHDKLNLRKNYLRKQKHKQAKSNNKAAAQGYKIEHLFSGQGAEQYDLKKHVQ